MHLHLPNLRCCMPSDHERDCQNRIICQQSRPDPRWGVDMRPALSCCRPVLTGEHDQAFCRPEGPEVRMQ